MTYIIKCFNSCYLLEIHQKPEIMDPERQNLLSIIRIREKKKERMGFKERFTRTMVSY